MSEQLKALGSMIKVARKQMRLSQDDLANAVNISKAYLSQIEMAKPHAVTGKSIRPTEKVLDRIASVLALPPNELRRCAGFASLESQSISEVTPDVPQWNSMQYIYDALPKDDQEEILAIVKLKYERNIKRPCLPDMSFLE